MKHLPPKPYFVFATLLVWAFSLSGCKNNTAENTISINNGAIELGFDTKTGAIEYFRNLELSEELLTDDIDGSLWDFDIIKPDSIETITMHDATQFTYSNPNKTTLILEWKNFKSLDNKDLKIIAKVNLEESKPMSHWRISLEGTKGLEIDQLAFPRINGIKDIGNEEMAVPYWLGQLFHNPRETLVDMQTESLGQSVGKQARYKFDYPGPLSLQLITLYDPDKYGLYLAANDTAAYSKSFSFSLSDNKSLTYELINYPSINTDSNTYSPVYEAIIGTFTGDWMTAATIYRDWGKRQPWSKNSRLVNNLVPQWAKETGLWVWNRGVSDKVIVPAVDLRKRSGLPVNVFWHWWHNCSYDDGFPEYLPPREGKESFEAAMNYANDHDVRAIVYMNSFQWGTETKSFKDEDAILSAVKDKNGNPRSHVYNIFTGKSLTNMCMGTDFWKNKYASLSDSVVNTYKANGIYMDQACMTRKCYDSTHGHPIGGGNYWVSNYRKLTEMIRTKTDSASDVLLAGEGVCEVWLPYLDAFLTLRVSMERFAGVGSREPIPFYSMVYHKYGIMYGNYSSLLVPPYDEMWPKEFAPKEPEAMLSKDFTKQYLMEQARTFVWGTQPTLANYRSFLATKRKPEIDYLITLAKVRYQGLKYLLYGEMLPSPKMDIPTEEIAISRLSIYAGKTGNSVTRFKKVVPLVLTGTWKSDDGQLGIPMASISDDPYEVNFTINSVDYKLPEAGSIYIIDINGRRKLSSYSTGQINVEFSLPSRGLCIIEVTP